MEKFYDVMVNGSIITDEGWVFSINGVFEKEKSCFQDEINRVARDCPDYGLYVSLDDIRFGDFRLYFSNTNGGSSTDFYAVRSKTVKDAKEVISSIIEAK